MAAHMSIDPGRPFASIGAGCAGCIAFEPLGLTADQPAADNDMSFFDDLAAELQGGVCELDDVLLDDLELPLPASVECAASTVCASPTFAPCLEQGSS
jgi:hypothetical protein